VLFLVVQGLFAFVETVGLFNRFRIGSFEQLFELFRSLAVEVDIDIFVWQSDQMRGNAFLI
jgi:hypothetical protein